MAGRAIDVVTLASAFHHCCGNRKGKAVSFFGSKFAAVEISVLAQLASSHCIDDRLSFGESIRKEFAATICDVLRLVVHVLATAGYSQQQARNKQSPRRPPQLTAESERAAQFGTSVTTRALVCSRKRRVRVISNCGSAASMQRKNLSLLASAKFGALKTG